MISKSVAETTLNITSILRNFKSFIKQVYQKNGRKILTRETIKITISEQKKVNRSKSNRHLNKKIILIFNNRENLLFF